jgi:hypothetical protein
MVPHALAISLWVAAAPAAPQADPSFGASRVAERDALRALATLAAGEPPIGEIQEAAARTADRQVGEGDGFARRARAAALLPRLTAEVRRDERSYRVVGLQSSGEVDYRHLSPGSAVLLRATWELGELVAARGELAAAAAAETRARRRADAVRRATALYYDRRRAQLELLLAPPESALARAEGELKVERLAAELDALTGGLLSGRRR